MEYGTAYGLALASGISAYIPLLSFAISARWFHWVTVNPDFAFVTSDWFIAILAVLTLADLVADKIPGLDHVWDLVHTVIRPIAGAIVAAAASNQVSGAGLPVTLVLGGTLAGMTHTTKATTRVASTVSTAGCLNIVLSTVEDIGVVAATLLSLFAPVVMLVVIGIFIIVFIFLARSIFRRFRKLFARPAPKTGS